MTPPTNPVQINRDRLAILADLILQSGNHKSFEDGACVMECVAYVAGEPFSDHPQCACPVLTSFCISLNDNWTEDDRQRLKPFVERLVGTRGGPEVELRRAMLIVEWTVTLFGRPTLPPPTPELRALLAQLAVQPLIDAQPEPPIAGYEYGEDCRLVAVTTEAP